MAYYYVKFVSGVFEGTKTTGSSGTPLTGTFASIGTAGCYGSIESAITNGGAGSGDVICVSDVHAYSQTGPINWIGPITDSGLLSIISVDDGECETEKVATTAQETSL